MHYAEFIRQLGKAGLTIHEFATLIAMNRNSISNCAKRDAVPSHLAVIVTLMGEMAEHRIDFKPALSQITIVPKKPRGAAAIGKFGGDKQQDIFIAVSKECHS